MGTLEVVPGGGARSKITQREVDRLLGLLNQLSLLEREIGSTAGDFIAKLLAGAELEMGTHEIEIRDYISQREWGWELVINGVARWRSVERGERLAEA